MCNNVIDKGGLPCGILFRWCHEAELGARHLGSGLQCPFTTADKIVIASAGRDQGKAERHHGILRQSTGCETKSSGGQEKPSGEHVNHSSRAPLPMKILLWEDGSGRGS